MKNYTKLAVKGVTTVFILTMLAAFLGYIVRVLLAKYLSMEEFGLFYAVFSFLGLWGIFKNLGFDKALIKFIPELQHEEKNDLIKSSIIYVSIVQLITNTIFIVLIYLLSNYLSVHFFRSTQASIVLKLMAIAFFIDGFVFILKFSFQGFQKMMLFAGIEVIRMSLIIAIVFIGLVLNYGILSPVIAYIFAPVILLLVFTPILTKIVFPEFSKSKFILNKILFKKLSKYSFFVMTTGMGSMIFGYTDSTVLTYFTSLKDVALYNIAFPTANLLIYFPRAINGILVPLTAELWAKKKYALLKAGMESLFKYSIIIIVPLAFMMSSFTDLLINTFFGKDYILASNAMRILIPGFIFGTLNGICMYFFSGIGKPEINSKILFIAATFNFITNLILIPIFGILGAALTTALSYVIMVVMSLKEIRRFINIKFPVKIWIKTFIAGLLFIFIIWFLKKAIFLNVWAETAIVIVISGISYMVLLFLLKIVDINELKDLYRRIITE